MTKRVINFGAGPATLHLPVLQRVQEEFLNYREIGASIIEIGHRTPQFVDLLEETIALFIELLEVPANYRVLFLHGGGQMQFSSVPMNLIAYKSPRRALYADTGVFAKRAAAEAEKYGQVEVVASSEETGYDRIPELDLSRLNREASYLYIVTNNTVFGTRWMDFPFIEDIPLVGDATSEILGRKIDISKFGTLYAGFQKNMGPSGQAVAIVREDLLNHALPETPLLLNYNQLAKDNSLTNTINVFAVYVCNLVLHWVQESGGVGAMAELNEQKAACLYGVLDNSGFYRAHSQPECRAAMNVTFDLTNEELTEGFIQEAEAEGLYKIKGHRERGGIRVSLYNAMTLQGAQAMADFMVEFERCHG